MDNVTTIRLELEVSAQRIINQVMLNNELIEEQLKKGIENAFAKFDFAVEAEAIAIKEIRNAISRSADYGKVQQIIRKKADELIEKTADELFENVRKKLQDIKELNDMEKK